MRIVRPAILIYRSLLALIVGGGVAFVSWQFDPQVSWLGLVPVIMLMWKPVRMMWKRFRWAQQDMALQHTEWLMAHVPFYATLRDEAKERFERDVRFFMEEQSFEGVAGVEVTDNLRLAVAAGAALLLHGRSDWEFDTRRTFLFYPDRFDEDYFDTDYANYDGMVHAQGPVILSVRAIEESWVRPDDGSNVVLHELAHLFEFSGALAAGMPSLIDRASAAAWQKLVRDEMQKIRRGESMLRSYAATNGAEFFAVAVENFFERPVRMQQAHPDLFEAMVALFNLNPTWK